MHFFSPNRLDENEKENKLKSNIDIISYSTEMLSIEANTWHARLVASVCAALMNTAVVASQLAGSTFEATWRLTQVAAY
jgi:hypothetical protein